MKDKWKHRRRIAYASFISIIIIAYFAITKSEFAKDSASIINTIVMILGSILLGYFGTSAAEEIKQTGNNAAKPAQKENAMARKYDR